MGEVYRARDTHLERDVAIKVLPHTLASDPERLVRFDREAKILAALNHPNIRRRTRTGDGTFMRGSVVGVKEIERRPRIAPLSPIPSQRS
jgi:serine/threonine protein kinase